MSQTPIENRCSALLRELRHKKGLTLEEFERFSNGAIKSVVLGSYERGTRAISLARLEQLAEIYEVPLQYFFCQPHLEVGSENGRLIFDLRRINRLAELDGALESIRRYLSTIVHRRADWNGQVISLRRSDNENLTLVSDLQMPDLISLLNLNGLLITTTQSGDRD